MAQIYDTFTLRGVQAKTKTVPAFFLTFFTQQINSQDEKIAFDKVIRDMRGMAPFVVPTAQGKVGKIEGYTTEAFKPAYVKPKHVIDPNLVIPRQPGEALGTGSLTLAQREQAVTAFLAQLHVNLHHNRWEWLAAKAAVYGKVTIKGDDYPETLVDFRRDPALTITSAWATMTADQIFEDLRLARKTANDKSMSGAVIRKLIFGGDAWSLFAKKCQDKLYGQNGLMDRTVGGSETSITRLWDGLEGVEYMGKIAGINGMGSFEIWVNTQKIKGDDGNEEYLMPQNGVFGISPEAMSGYRCFGAILDTDAGYQSLEIFPKMWKSEDPSCTYIMSQGAPLMVPGDANATFLIYVG